MNNKINNLFCDAEGSSVYKRIISYVKKEGIDKKLREGVLLGFSGGADSVFLLAFLVYYRNAMGLDFPILACHVNHGIRGLEADRDESFSYERASELGVEFISRRVDVPTLAKKLSQGIEEAARNARYSCFNEIISGRNDISTIAVAHNATDNCETVVFNLARGSGINGISGIKPVRDNIVRPILCVAKHEILALLDKHSISYATDSTNSDCDYTRNFIRHKILPLLSDINPAYTEAISRMSENLRDDMDYIGTCAEAEYRRILKDGKISREDLITLHSALSSRILMLYAKEYASAELSGTHISDISSLLHDDNFSYSISGEYNFICERGICYFAKKNEAVSQDFSKTLALGFNHLDGYACDIYVGKASEFSSNIYNFSIKTNISSAIIDSGMFVRFRRNADSYRYDGITHKLKKVFNDRDIPPSVRNLIPIICDNDGIVWVPGLKVRDGLYDKTGEYIIAVCIREPNSTDTQIFVPDKLNSKNQI